MHRYLDALPKWSYSNAIPSKPWVDSRESDLFSGSDAALCVFTIIVLWLRASLGSSSRSWGNQANRGGEEERKAELKKRRLSKNQNKTKNAGQFAKSLQAGRVNHTALSRLWRWADGQSQRKPWLGGGGEPNSAYSKHAHVWKLPYISPQFFQCSFPKTCQEQGQHSVTFLWLTEEKKKKRCVASGCLSSSLLYTDMTWL